MPVPGENSRVDPAADDAMALRRHAAALRRNSNDLRRTAHERLEKLAASLAKQIDRKDP